MKISYTARSTNVTPEVKEYCEKRIQALEKILGYSVEADILLSVEKYRQKVEINLRTKKATFHTVEETYDMSSSLVGAFENVERRVKKERDKLRERKRRRAKEPNMYTAREEPEEHRARLIKSHNYTMKPLSVEEALVQLEAGKQEIFMFRNRESENWSVVYRRKDGNFGLTEPE